MISRSLFKNCTAITGGAIYADNPQYLTINRTLFLDNYAYYSKDAASLSISGAGGSLYYTCNEINLNCAADLQNKNNFTNSTAEV